MELSHQAEGAPAASTAPDWRLHPNEILCPICQYNLRGLVEPRCPECGYQFEWLKLLDDRLRPHPFLFEHHPESNFKSFCKTAWAGLRPFRFWKSLNLVQPTRPRRLLIYWIGAMLLSMQLLVVEYLCFIVFLVRLISSQRRFPPGLSFWKRTVFLLGSSRPWYQEVLSLAQYDLLLLLLAAVAAWNLLWPWMTYLALRVLIKFRYGGRVLRSHFLQCVLYSFDTSIWSAALCIPLLVISAFSAGYSPATSRFGTFARDEILPWLGGLVLASYLFSVFRLIAGCRIYLNFRWPTFTVLASQVIVILVAAIVPIYAYFVLR